MENSEPTSTHPDGSLCPHCPHPSTIPTNQPTNQPSEEERKDVGKERRDTRFDFVGPKSLKARVRPWIERKEFGPLVCQLLTEFLDGNGSEEYLRSQVAELDRKANDLQAQRAALVQRIGRVKKAAQEVQRQHVLRDRLRTIIKERSNPPFPRAPPTLDNWRAWVANNGDVKVLGRDQVRAMIKEETGVEL